MALTQQQINLLEYTPQGYRLKGTGGGADTYYENTPFGYNQVGTPLPTVTHTPQYQGPAPSTAVYSGQIVPQTSLAPTLDKQRGEDFNTYLSRTGFTKSQLLPGADPSYDPQSDPNFTGNIFKAPAVNTSVPSGPIPVTQIKPSTPIDIPTPAPVLSTAGSLVAGMGETSKNIQRKINELTPEQVQYNAAEKRIQELLPQTTGQAQSLANEEAARGVDTLRNSYANLNSQILTKTAEYKQLNDQFGALSVANEGRAITMNLMIGSERQINNQRIMMLNAKASDIGLLQSQALGMQGQIEAAQEAAKRAVDLKYAPILEELKVKQAQVTALQPVLDAQEKKQAAALTNTYKQQQDALTVQVVNEKDKNSTLLNQMQKYPDANISLNDTLQSANQKITTNSRIYQKEISQGSSGGGLFGTNGQAVDNARLITQAIINGNQPPVTTGLYGATSAVKANLERQGYNYMKANQDWIATGKLFSTLNGTQQTRLRQAVNQVSESLDLTQSLADEWNAGSFPVLNKVAIAAAKNGLYGQQAQSIATRLDAQIADITSELGTVYKGGNSSTDESLKLAAQNLQSNWTKKTFDDAVNLAKQNIQIRMNSLNLSTAGIGTSQYNSTQAPVVDPNRQPISSFNFKFN